MYEPQEDSFLLQKQVKKYAKGIVLDMGTGSGILAVEAAKSQKVVKVYAVDIDNVAIDYCKENNFYKITLTCKEELIPFYERNNFEVYQCHMSQLL